MSQKKRLEVYTHEEIVADVEPISANVGTSRSMVMDKIEISGIRGSIQLYNKDSANAITVETWVSNYKNSEDPLNNPEKWVMIDSRSLSAGSSDVVRISGTYKWICVTAVASTTAGPLYIIPYFCRGGI